MSNHRESSCFHTEMLQLHDVSLKNLQKLRVVCAAAQPSGHSLPLSLHQTDVNWAMGLGTALCLRTADLVLTWNVPSAWKTSVTFNFLITTSAPVFVPLDPKFPVRENTQPMQGGPALLNS